MSLLFNGVVTGSCSYVIRLHECYGSEFMSYFQRKYTELSPQPKKKMSILSEKILDKNISVFYRVKSRFVFIAWEIDDLKEKGKREGMLFLLPHLFY